MDGVNKDETGDSTEQIELAIELTLAFMANNPRLANEDHMRNFWKIYVYPTVQAFRLLSHHHQQLDFNRFLRQIITYLEALPGYASKRYIADCLRYQVTLGAKYAPSLMVYEVEDYYVKELLDQPGLDLELRMHYLKVLQDMFSHLEGYPVESFYYYFVLHQNSLSNDHLRQYAIRKYPHCPTLQGLIHGHYIDMSSSSLNARQRQMLSELEKVFSISKLPPINLPSSDKHLHVQVAKEQKKDNQHGLSLKDVWCVLDTNVLLSDPKRIQQLSHLIDLVIPDAVIRELQAMRQSLSSPKNSPKQLRIGKAWDCLQSGQFQELLANGEMKKLSMPTSTFDSSSSKDRMIKMDDLIIDLTLQLQCNLLVESNIKRRVIFVTDDVNASLKAKAEGLTVMSLHELNSSLYVI